jgi:hypothetical protein
MKFSFAAVASLLASVAYSQTIASEVAQIPSCALSCLTTAITGAGCGLTDYACQCGSSKDAITKAATPCVVSSCSTSDALSMFLPNKLIGHSNKLHRGAKRCERDLYYSIRFRRRILISCFCRFFNRHHDQSRRLSHDE